MGPACLSQGSDQLASAAALTVYHDAVSQAQVLAYSDDFWVSPSFLLIVPLFLPLMRRVPGGSALPALGRERGRARRRRCPRPWSRVPGPGGGRRPRRRRPRPRPIRRDVAAYAARARRSPGRSVALHGRYGPAPSAGHHRKLDDGRSPNTSRQHPMRPVQGVRPLLLRQDHDQSHSTGGQHHPLSPSARRRSASTVYGPPQPRARHVRRAPTAPGSCIPRPEPPEGGASIKDGKYGCRCHFELRPHQPAGCWRTATASHSRGGAAADPAALLWEGFFAEPTARAGPPPGAGHSIRTTVGNADWLAQRFGVELWCPRRVAHGPAQHKG